MPDEPQFVEFPFYFRENTRDGVCEVRKQSDDSLIGTFEKKIYADYVTSLLNFAHALGNQAKTLAEL